VARISNINITTILAIKDLVQENGAIHLQTTNSRTVSTEVRTIPSMRYGQGVSKAKKRAPRRKSGR
jgi:hypothetical protein